MFAAEEMEAAAIPREALVGHLKPFGFSTMSVREFVSRARVRPRGVDATARQALRQPQHRRSARDPI